MVNQLLYGFLNMADVAGALVTEVGVTRVQEALDATIAAHNREIDAMTGLFVARTTDFKRSYANLVSGRLQPLDENGRARPVKGQSSYENAWPLHMAGTAYGFNYVTSQKVTVQQLNDIVKARTDEDTAWMRDHILAALFANVAWTHTDVLYVALTITGLANGDTVLYQTDGAGFAMATDTHYGAQAAAIATAANPFPAIYNELKEHPDNGGQVIAFVPTALRASIEGVATFVPVSDPNVSPASTAQVLTGNLNATYPGVLFGYLDGVFVVEWSRLPADIIVAVTTEGERPLMMREDPTPSLQGFKLVAERNDHPWYERQFLRIAGFGSNNRVGAYVYRVGDASYAIPTGYTSPMP
jgi:hypothetical protein